MVVILFLIIIFACYGSFLNSFAYRLINNKSLLTKRSYCPHCYKTIKFYDLIPIVSFFLLRAKCRNCKKKISILYPIIEILSSLIFTSLILFINPKYWFSYFIFFSSLIIIIRTDFETMLISLYTTLYLVPIAFLLSYFNFTELTFTESFIGAIFGYFFVLILVKIYSLFINRKREMIGFGDLDLLSLIGSFSGINGVINSLFLGSFLSIIAFIFISIFNKIDNLEDLRNYKIRFGPWLSISSILYIFFKQDHLGLFLFDYLGL